MMMHKKNEQRGMVLIIALIMLALITFLVVAFLSFTRLDRSAVTMSVRQTETYLAIDAGLAHAQSAVVDEIKANRNYQVLVSTNNDGVAFEGLIPDQDLELLNKAPRAPVYYDTDGDRNPDESRYFLNLNHDLNATKSAAFQPTTINQVGDPHWIGVLEDPSLPHGKDNRFVARYAYMVTPADKLLDINHAHNNAKELDDEEGYLRGHGNAAWELNLAGSLAMLDPVAFSYSEYFQRPGRSSLGEAFRHAGGPNLAQTHYVGLWNYRYPWPPGSDMDAADMDAVQLGMPNQREHVDIMNFLRPPYRPVLTGMKHITHEGVTEWLKKDKTGTAFYNLAGAFSTLTAEAPATSKTIDAMGVRLGQPPKVKLLLNEYFSDDDFSEFTDSVGKWPMKESTQVQTNNMNNATVADTLVFDGPHGFSRGQRVHVIARAEDSPVGGRIVWRLISPSKFEPVNGRWFYVNVVDSRSIQLCKIPLRRGSGKPDEEDLVRLMIIGQGNMPVDFINTVPLVKFSFELRHDPLAKKFTRLASLLLDNAMKRKVNTFHIGSDDTLTLFNNEFNAKAFGADNIQIYPQPENNFTPEVQRLLQVALNLAEVYSPVDKYDINGDAVRNLNVAWPLVFRPIISHEAGDKVYIAGWKRVMWQRSFHWDRAEWWTNGRDLPTYLPGGRIDPLDWLGELADRPWVPGNPAAGVPPRSGNGDNRFPLLIGVNKRTQVQFNGLNRIWPSVNELSTSVTMPFKHDASGTSRAQLKVRVELRDNLYAIYNNNRALLLPLKLRLLVKGTISGTLNGTRFSEALDCNKYLSVDPTKKQWQIFHLLQNIPLTLNPEITTDPSKRILWEVKNLKLKADIVILCGSPEDSRFERIVDISRVNFSANLPPQYKDWKANKKYKKGEQTEFGGRRYYARRAHESFDPIPLFGNMFWKLAEWNKNERFYFNEIIRCRELVGGKFKERLFRCLLEHESTGDPSARFDPTRVTSKGQPCWARYRGETYEMSWQVNDPLVNGMSRDYTLVHPMEKNNAHPDVKLAGGKEIPPPPYTLYESIDSNNLSIENYVYRPWNLDEKYYTNRDAPSPWADSYDHTTLKDPGVQSPDDWIFPHKDIGGMKTLGSLGMVHRGTPWQSIYLKSKRADRLLIRSIDDVSGVITPDSVPFFWDGDFVKLEGGGPPEYQNQFGSILPGLILCVKGTTYNKLSDGVGYTYNSDDPSSWMYLVSTDAWQRQTGSLDTLPTNDHRLVDLFSTSQSPAAATGLLSVNAKSPAAWGAVLSGVAVPNKVHNPGGITQFHERHFGNCMNPNCMGTYDKRRLAPGAFMSDMIDSINRHRGEIPFERVSDILKVSELTDGNRRFLNMIKFAKLNTANSPQAYAQKFFPNEIDYERIPQQILSLLRTDGTPRFVAYTFSQTLKPAQLGMSQDRINGQIRLQNAIKNDGLCTNYAITSEAAQRTVFRLEGVDKWREYHFKIKHTVPANLPARPRMVIESTAPLILR